MTAKAWRLPVLAEMLDRDTGRAEDSQAQAQKEIIEKTLADFGYTIEIQAIHEGPMVTQFGLKPGPDTRLSKIKGLDQDLALALSGLPVQIAEPTPDYPSLRLIVPKQQRRLVRMRRLLESDAFKESHGNLKIALGLDAFGQPVVIDLTEMPHLLIGGMTGSGKSMCLNGMIAGLLCIYRPDQVQFLLIDPAQVELKQYNGIPHLFGSIVTDSETVVEALETANKEINRRFTEFSKLGMRDLLTYNRRAPHVGRQLYPYLVIIIDNLVDLMMRHPTKVENNLTRIAAMGRSAGVHLVFATQRSNVEIVSGAIKANASVRIAFQVTSNIDSRLILDGSGAEELRGPGDMLYRAPTTNQPQRVQGVFVSDAEIIKLVRFWRRQ